jgi:hypothetical protein
VLVAKRIPKTTRAVTQRVRRGSAAELALLAGRGHDVCYYLVDVVSGRVVEKIEDLEGWAREHGYLKAWEELEKN